MAIYPKKGRLDSPVAVRRQPASFSQLQMPNITDKMINPQHVRVNRPQGADGRFATYHLGPGANYDATMKAVGTPDRNFQIKDLGIESMYDAQYHKPMKKKDLEAIGFNPVQWKGAKQVGQFTQSGRTYPIVQRDTQIRQPTLTGSGSGGTGERKWSASARKLQTSGVGRAHAKKDNVNY